MQIQIHLTETLIELNVTGTLAEEIDVISQVSEFDEAFSLLSINEMPFILNLKRDKCTADDREEEMELTKKTVLLIHFDVNFEFQVFS